MIQQRTTRPLKSPYQLKEPLRIDPEILPDTSALYPTMTSEREYRNHQQHQPSQYSRLTYESRTIVQPTDRQLSRGDRREPRIYHDYTEPPHHKHFGTEETEPRNSTGYTTSSRSQEEYSNSNWARGDLSSSGGRRFYERKTRRHPDSLDYNGYKSACYDSNVNDSGRRSANVRPDTLDERYHTRNYDYRRQHDVGSSECGFFSTGRPMDRVRNERSPVYESSRCVHQHRYCSFDERPAKYHGNAVYTHEARNDYHMEIPSSVHHQFGGRMWSDYDSGLYTSSRHNSGLWHPNRYDICRRRGSSCGRDRAERTRAVASRIAFSRNRGGRRQNSRELSSDHVKDEPWWLQKQYRGGRPPRRRQDEGRSVTRNHSRCSRTLSPTKAARQAHQREVVKKPRPVAADPIESKPKEHIDWFPGMRLGEHLRVIKAIGEGTFGKVLECQDLRFNRLVAVKIVRAGTDYADAAIIEAQILTQLNKQDPEGQSGCVTLYEYFTCGNHVCLVMERLGIDLYEFLMKNKCAGLCLEDIQTIAADITRCLAFFKKVGLTHTDLKPENIVLVEDEAVVLENTADEHTIVRPRNAHVKVVDFGGATWTTREDELFTSLINTRQYRAPEVILGKNLFSASLLRLGMEHVIRLMESRLSVGGTIYWQTPLQYT